MRQDPTSKGWACCSHHSLGRHCSRNPTSGAASVLCAACISAGGGRRRSVVTWAAAEPAQDSLQELRMWPDRRLLDLLRIDLPILQAPMAGATGSAMAIAVNEAGGLGSLP